MGEGMNNIFKVRWTDDKGIEREKIYSDVNSQVAHDQAMKACKWLNDNGAVADLAMVKRIKAYEGDEEPDKSMFPSK